MRKHWSSILSALFLIGSSPIIGWEVFLLFLFVPWFSFLKENKSYKDSMISSLIITTIYSVFNYSWIPETLTNFFEFGDVKSIIIFMGMILLTKTTFIIYSLIVTLLNNKGIKYSLLNIIMLATLYSALDYYLPTFFYDTLGHYTYDTSVISSLSRIIGVYGISFLIILINWSIVTRKYKLLLIPVVLLLVNYNISYTNNHKKIKVMNLQLNINIDMYRVQSKAYYGFLDRVIDYVKNNYDSENIIVFPETILPNDTESVAYSLYKDKFNKLAKELRADIFIGGSIKKDNEVYNTYIKYREGDFSYSFKEDLFPMGEYLPVAELTRLFLPLSSEVNLSQENSLLDLDGNKILPLICYESITNDKYLKYIDSSSLILNPTNELWFSEKGKVLTEALSRFKSFESQKVMIRSGLNTTSGIYYPNGSSSISYNKNKEINHISNEVYLNDKLSFYEKYRNIISWIYFGSFFYFIILLVNRHK